MIIKAVFKGLNGSLGYKHGQTYLLKVKHNTIRKLDGLGVCIYGSTEAFLKNWSIV